MNNLLENKVAQYILGAVAVVLFLFLGAKTLAQFGFVQGDQAYYNSITVTGTGEVYAVADIGTFSYSVSKTEKEVSVAQSKAAEISNSAISFLKENGVDEKDIKTTSYNVYPEYEWIQPTCTSNFCPAGKQVLKGYQVSQSVEVKVRDTSKVGDILSGVGKLGVTNVSSLNFSVDDIKTLQTQARDKAIADAKVQATKLSKALGVSLSKVVGYYENINEPGYPMYAKGGDMMEARVASVVPDLPKGENKITSSISITYQIR